MFFSDTPRGRMPMTPGQQGDSSASTGRPAGNGLVPAKLRMTYAIQGGLPFWKSVTIIQWSRM